LDFAAFAAFLAQLNYFPALAISIPSDGRIGVNFSLLEILAIKMTSRHDDGTSGGPETNFKHTTEVAVVRVSVCFTLLV
jgi:hypothetical protein